MKKIIVTVKVDGSVELETRGYQGHACLEESRFLKELLGEEIAVQLCPTFYKRGKETVKRHLPLCG